MVLGCFIWRCLYKYYIWNLVCQMLRSFYVQSSCTCRGIRFFALKMVFHCETKETFRATHYKVIELQGGW